MSQILEVREGVAKRARAAETRVEEIVGAGFDVGKFVESFEVIAEAAGGVARLRGLVLDIAIRGLLVLEGERSLASRHAGEGAFALPAAWAWSTLGSALDKITDGTHHSPPNGPQGPFMYVTAKNIKPYGVELSGVTYVDRATHDEIYKRCGPQLGDVLLIKDGATTGVATINQISEPFSMLSSVALLRPGRAVTARYLLHYLRSPFFYEFLRGSMKGVAITRVTLTQLKASPIPLPPVAEQKKLVAKVDQLMALCDDLEARQTKKRETGTRLTKSALEALTTAEGPEEFDAAWKRVVENFDVIVDRAEKVGGLRRAVLELAVRGRLVPASRSPAEVEALEIRIAEERAAMIEGRRKGGRGSAAESSEAEGTASAAPYELPAGWSWRVLADIAGHIVDGTHHTPKYVTQGMDFISAKDIREGRITFEGCRQISKEEFDDLTKRCRPKRGDVLVTKSGSIGEVAVVDVDRAFTLFESVALVPVVSAVNSQYAAYVVYLGASGKFGAENQRGVGVRHLHLVDLRRLPFPLPPRKEQDAIVKRVQHLLKVCDDLEARLRRAEDRSARLVEAVVQELVA